MALPASIQTPRYPAPSHESGARLVSRRDTCTLGDDDTTAVTLLPPPDEAWPPHAKPSADTARALDVAVQPRSGTRRAARHVGGPPPLPSRVGPPPLPSTTRQPAPPPPRLFWYSELPATKPSPPKAPSLPRLTPAPAHHRRLLALLFGSTLITLAFGVLIGFLARRLG